jgi:hypothetical protein
VRSKRDHIASRPGHGRCYARPMHQTGTPQRDSATDESSLVQQQWRYGVAHLADMVRLHEALLGLPLAGSSSSRRAALAELERCIAEAHGELQDLSRTMGREVPAELSRPDGSRVAAQTQTLTHEEEAEFASALASLGYDSSKFSAQLSDDGRLVIATLGSRVQYERRGWLAKFAAHLKQGLFGPPSNL